LSEVVLKSANKNTFMFGCQVLCSKLQQSECRNVYIVTSCHFCNSDDSKTSSGLVKRHKSLFCSQ